MKGAEHTIQAGPALDEEKPHRQPAHDSPWQHRHAGEPCEEHEPHQGRDVEAPASGASAEEQQAPDRVVHEWVSLGLQPQRDHPVRDIGDRDDGASAHRAGS